MEKIQFEITISDTARSTKSLAYLAEELHDFFEQNPLDERERLFILGGFDRAASLFSLLQDSLISLRDAAASLETYCEKELCAE